MDLQIGIVVLVIAMAAIYLIRRWYRMWWSGKGGGCGGCGGDCETPSKPAGNDPRHTASR